MIRIRARLFASALTIFLIGGGPAFADQAPAAPASDKEWADCEQEDDHDLGIAACTAIIARGAQESEADQATAFFNRAVDHAAKGDHDKAVADYGEAIRLDAKNAEAHFSRGHSLSVMGEHDRAIVDYDAFIELNPEDSGVFVARGDAYLAKGDRARAIADYTEAVKLDPEDSEPLVKRADAYDADGDFRKALDDFEAALRLDPSLQKAMDGGAKAKAKLEGGGK